MKNIRAIKEFGIALFKKDIHCLDHLDSLELNTTKHSLRCFTYLVDPWSQNAPDHQYPASSAVTLRSPGWIWESQGTCYPCQNREWKWERESESKKKNELVRVSHQALTRSHVSGEQRLARLRSYLTCFKIHIVAPHDGEELPCLRERLCSLCHLSGRLIFSTATYQFR